MENRKFQPEADASPTAGWRVPMALKILGIIPSRYGSKRLPAKSLADIYGKPMVQHVYERARQSRLLTDIIVATDDERIEAAVKKITELDELLTPNVVKVVLDENNFALYFTRSLVPFVRDSNEVTDWLKHATFYKHFGIYVYRAPFLQQFTSFTPSCLEQVEKLEQLRILEHGYRIKAAITEYDSIPVDTQEDLDRVRKQFKTQNL